MQAANTSPDQLKRIVIRPVSWVILTWYPVGNDGMRFVLDDMTVEATGKHLCQWRCEKAILEGTKAYYDDPNGQALTQR